jgi:hypothetical protein
VPIQSIGQLKIINEKLKIVMGMEFWNSGILEWWNDGGKAEEN